MVKYKLIASQSFNTMDEEGLLATIFMNNKEGCTATRDYYHDCMLRDSKLAVGQKVFVKPLGVEGYVVATFPISQDSGVWDYKVQIKIPDTEKYSCDLYNRFDLKAIG